MISHKLLLHGASGLIVGALLVAACSDDNDLAQDGGTNTDGGPQTCEDVGGTECGADQFCSGSFIIAGCCDGVCKDIPTCDGVPMAKAPEGFLSVDVYEIRHTHESDWIDEAARLMGEAQVARVKKPLLWYHLEPDSNDVWDEEVLAEYDALLQAYRDNGVEVEIELLGTPRWASGCGDPQYTTDDCNSIGVAAGYPPTSMDDWRDYVTTAVNRYKDFSDRWAIWAEPDRDYMWRGTPEQYVLHLNAAVEIIRQIDPDAEILSPQLNVGSWVFGDFWDDLTNNHWRRWIETVTQTGEHDVFSIHILLEETVPDIVYCYDQVRQALDALGKPDVPITVSSTQILGAIPAVPGAPRDLQCPYIDQTTHEVWSEEDQAAELTRIYACLANAGAQGVSWFRISDLDANLWLYPCPGQGCTCEPGANPPSDTCACDNPDEVNCTFWCPPDGIDRSGILAPYNLNQPAGQRFRTKAAYDAVQLIAEYLMTP